MSARPKIGIIVGSTRPARIGRRVADELVPVIEASGADAVMLDLAEIALPFFDEEAHPRTDVRVHPHTIAWAEQVAALDGVVFLTPEYNSSFSAPMKNAIDSLYAQWVGKPGLIVSYGWSGGASAAAHLGAVLRHIGVALQDGVELTFEPSDFREDRTFGEVAPFVARHQSALLTAGERLTAAAEQLVAA